MSLGKWMSAGQNISGSDVKHNAYTRIPNPKCILMDNIWSQLNLRLVNKSKSGYQTDMYRLCEGRFYTQTSPWWVYVNKENVMHEFKCFISYHRVQYLLYFLSYNNYFWYVWDVFDLFSTASTCDVNVTMLHLMDFKQTSKLQDFQSWFYIYMHLSAYFALYLCLAHGQDWNITLTYIIDPFWTFVV